DRRRAVFEELPQELSRLRGRGGLRRHAALLRDGHPTICEGLLLLSSHGGAPYSFAGGRRLPGTGAEASTSLSQTRCEAWPLARQSCFPQLGEPLSSTAVLNSIRGRVVFVGVPAAEAGSPFLHVQQV